LAHDKGESVELPSDIEEGPSRIQEESVTRHSMSTYASHNKFRGKQRGADNYYEKFIDDSLRAIGDLISVKKKLKGDLTAIQNQTEKEKEEVSKHEKRAIDLEASISKELETA
jgi:hypothetical protein